MPVVLGFHFSFMEELGGVTATYEMHWMADSSSSFIAALYVHNGKKDSTF